VILLSPGFSSYDAFPGFDARAARFRQLVEEAP
jgi:UDP-N-acetylmuramoylalanine-D-glutamate ligase